MVGIPAGIYRPLASKMKEKFKNNENKITIRGKEKVKIICKYYMTYDNIIISEQPLFRTISERRQSRKAFVENPVEIRNCFTAVKGESPQSDTACFQFSNDLQDRGQ